MSRDNIDATGDDLLVDFVAHLLQQKSAIAELQRSCDQASERIDSLNITPRMDYDRPPPPAQLPNPEIPHEPAADSHQFSGQQASSRLKRHVCPMLHRKRCVPTPAECRRLFVGSLQLLALTPSTCKPDFIRRNRTLLRAWKHCAALFNWTSWESLSPAWENTLLSWSTEHAQSCINPEDPLAFAAMTGGFEDFLCNTCDISAAWGLNALNLPSTSLWPATVNLPLPFTKKHRIYFRTRAIPEPHF